MTDATKLATPNVSTATLETTKAPGPPAVSALNLGHSFGDKVALAPGLDLHIPAASGVVGLLGPNGSGKSTLMRLLTGLVPKRQGTVTVDGVPLEGDGLKVRQRVTYAPGEMHLYGEFSGREHLKFLLRGRSAAAQARAEDLAETMELPLRRRVRTYSHGMKRQLVFAAALAPDVRVRILDEISEGLDPAKRAKILELIAEDAKRGTSILLSSHHLGEIDLVCDRLLFLGAGKLIADESAKDARARARRLLTLRFDPKASATAIGAALDRAGAVSVDCSSDGVARVSLNGDDPRMFLARAMADEQLPVPTEIQFGRHSLPELFSALYGVEGV